MEPNPIKILEAGGVGVIPTDTLYGLVARADLPAAVERVRRLKNRSANKPFIILLSGWEDLRRFGVTLTQIQKAALLKYWPGPTSVILGTQAFRLPNLEWLRDLIRATGPLVAPSANPEGLPPATTVAEAKNYFGAQADFYLDHGPRLGPASTLLELAPDGAVKIRRSAGSDDKQSQSDAPRH
jgi:L-threonylcarbamoyladenylate synthase